jgi:hypothetical protein
MKEAGGLCRQTKFGGNTIRKPRPFSKTELNRTVQFLYSDPDDVSATGSKYFHCSVLFVK